MPNPTLTSEQLAVVHHPQGRHAHILAVAGSGKTSTLVYRVRHLVQEAHVSRDAIQVLMFNRLARRQFSERMDQAEVPRARQPKVDTFHSFAFRFIQDMTRRGLLPATLDHWIDDREEFGRFNLHRVINDLEKRRVIPPDSVDPEEAMEVIQLWKGSLIPPERAGYRGNPYLGRVYAAYEELRNKLNALTYDDYIPTTVRLLEKNPSVRQEYSAHLRHIIIDEYQDVNYGQQRLIELLAGHQADLMVVGDDDQTIYEWRGARPNYIIREFQSVFNNKPFNLYHLSHSFRFGPVIAQAAFNLIRFNTDRAPKPLVAHFPEKEAAIHLIESPPKQRQAGVKQLGDQIVNLVKQQQVDPRQIAVLGRMYAQLSGIQAEFLSRGVPFRVEGQQPFYNRHEVNVLLNYLRLAQVFYQPITPDAERLVLSVANVPSRMLARREVEQLIHAAGLRGYSPAKALDRALADPASLFTRTQKERIQDWINAMERASLTLRKQADVPAHLLLEQLVVWLDFLSHFDNYFGKGEASFDRKQSIENFLEYSKTSAMPAAAFLDHIAKLDTTRGAPPEQQIVLTTVFRTKGLEYDYVFIPDCIEGYMPCLYETGSRVYDLTGQIQEPEPSEALENERRLFYVALTRARRAVFIATAAFGAALSGEKAAKPSRFLDELQLAPTLDVMGAVQRLASGQPTAAAELEHAVRRHPGARAVLSSLVDGYLGRLDHPVLTGQIAALVAQGKEHPFRYRYAYAAPQMVSGQTERKTHKSWDDVK